MKAAELGTPGVIDGEPFELGALEYLRAVTYKAGGLSQGAGCGISFRTQTARQFTVRGEQYDGSSDASCQGSEVVFEAPVGHMISGLLTSTSGRYEVTGLATEPYLPTSERVTLVQVWSGAAGFDAILFQGATQSQVYWGAQGADEAGQKEELLPTEYIMIVTHTRHPNSGGCSLRISLSSGRSISFDSPTGCLEDAVSTRFEADFTVMVVGMVGDTVSGQFVLKGIHTTTPPPGTERAQPAQDRIRGIHIAAGDYISNITLDAGPATKSYFNPSLPATPGTSSALLGDYELIRTIFFKPLKLSEAGGMACSVTFITSDARTLPFQSALHDQQQCEGTQIQEWEVPAAANFRGFRTSFAGRIVGLDTGLVLEEVQPGIEFGSFDSIAGITSEFVNIFNLSSSQTGSSQSYYHNHLVTPYQLALQQTSLPGDETVVHSIPYGQWVTAVSYRGPAPSGFIACSIRFYLSGGSVLRIDGSLNVSGPCALEPGRRATIESMFQAPVGSQVIGLETRTENAVTFVSGILTDLEPIIPCPADNVSGMLAFLNLCVGCAIGVAVLKALSTSLSNGAQGTRDWIVGDSGAGLAGAGLILISHAQFLAISGRIGGDTLQPSGTLDFYYQLNWVNYHLLDIFEVDSSCLSLKDKRTELFSTVLLATLVLVGVGLVRLLCDRVAWYVVKWMRERHRKERLRLKKLKHEEAMAQREQMRAKIRQAEEERQKVEEERQKAEEERQKAEEERQEGDEKHHEALHSQTQEADQDGENAEEVAPAGTGEEEVVQEPSAEEEAAVDSPQETSDAAKAKGGASDTQAEGEKDPHQRVASEQVSGTSFGAEASRSQGIRASPASQGRKPQEAFLQAKKDAVVISQKRTLIPESPAVTPSKKPESAAEKLNESTAPGKLGEGKSPGNLDESKSSETLSKGKSPGTLDESVAPDLDTNPNKSDCHVNLEDSKGPQVEQRQQTGGLFPFPAWELKVVELQFLGLSESVGLALVSGCPGYAASGAVILLAWILLFAVVTRTVQYGFQWNKQIYLHIPIGFFQTFSEALLESRSLHHDRHWMKHWFLAFGEALVTGYWVNHEQLSHQAQSFFLDPYSNFARRYGPMYNAYSHRRELFQLWILARDIATGVVVATVTTDTSNSAAILGIFAADFVGTCLVAPWANRAVNLIAGFSSFMKLLHCVMIFGRMGGWLLENCEDFNVISFVLAFLGVVPLVLFIVVFQGWEILQLLTRPPHASAHRDDGLSLSSGDTSPIRSVRVSKKSLDSVSHLSTDASAIRTRRVSFDGNYQEALPDVGVPLIHVPKPAAPVEETFEQKVEKHVERLSRLEEQREQEERKSLEMTSNDSSPARGRNGRSESPSRNSPEGVPPHRRNVPGLSSDNSPSPVAVRTGKLRSAPGSPIAITRQAVPNVGREAQLASGDETVNETPLYSASETPLLSRRPSLDANRAMSQDRSRNGLEGHKASKRLGFTGGIKQWGLGFGKMAGSKSQGSGNNSEAISTHTASKGQTVNRSNGLQSEKNRSANGAGQGMTLESSLVLADSNGNQERTVEGASTASNTAIELRASPPTVVTAPPLASDQEPAEPAWLRHSNGYGSGGARVIKYHKGQNKSQKRETSRFATVRSIS